MQILGIDVGGTGIKFGVVDTATGTLIGERERILTPKPATPKAVVTRLHAEVHKALQGKDVRERMTAVGGEVLPGPTEQFAQLIQSERRRYEKLVREANIKPD